MKVIEILKLGRNLIELLQKSCIRMDDVLFIGMYDEYIEIISNGNKKSYAVTVLSKKYGISNGRMTICGVEYPVFKRSEIESRRAEIEALALLPYRGKKIPHIITVEEMKKLKGE